MRSLPLQFCAILALTVLFAACSDDPQDADALGPADEGEAVEMTVETASAVLEPLADSGVSGSVTFTPVDGGVRVSANVTGLSEGLHGFHVHEGSSCADAGAAADGHYAPEGSPHGAPDNDATTRHTGDLGNLTANADGVADYDRVDPVLTLDGPNSIVGKAMIVHAGTDDLTSQPSGDAGDRVACGVIQMDM